jgi:hypothetical protein
MLGGNLHLSLMIGPVVPVPVSRAVVDALQSVTVRRSTDEPSGFQMVFDLDSGSPLTTLLTLLGQVGPTIRVVLTVTVSGIPTVLMDGVVTNHQVSPDPTTGRSTLTVSGTDLTTVMDLVSATGIPYPGMPRVARAAAIIAKYAVFGMIPLTIPSVVVDVPIPTDRVPTHQGTDLAYLKQMAEEVGYVFYVDPGPAPLTNTAYWGPEIKVGPPQPALTVNMDGHTNVESLTFDFDGDSAVLSLVYVQEPTTKAAIPIPIPSVNPLSPPLGAIPPLPARVEMLRDTARLNPAQAIMQGLARASETADAVSGSGSLDVMRYGHVLKARGLVGVRGAGPAFSGLYYVDSVTHNLRRGAYTQDFTLTRNGLVSTVPRVPV